MCVCLSPPSLPPCCLCSRLTLQQTSLDQRRRGENNHSHSVEGGSGEAASARSDVSEWGWGHPNDLAAPKSLSQGLQQLRREKPCVPGWLAGSPLPFQHSGWRSRLPPGTRSVAPCADSLQEEEAARAQLAASWEWVGAGRRPHTVFWLTGQNAGLRTCLLPTRSHSSRHCDLPQEGSLPSCLLPTPNPGRRQAEALSAAGHRLPGHGGRLQGLGSRAGPEWTARISAWGPGLPRPLPQAVKNAWPSGPRAVGLERGWRRRGRGKKRQTSLRCQRTGVQGPTVAGSHPCYICLHLSRPEYEPGR